MPYERTQTKLEDFLAKALSKEEIQDGARKAELREDVLKQKFLDPSLGERAPRLWEAAASEIEAYDQVENDIRARLTELRNELRQMRLSYLRIPRWALITIFVALPLLTSLLIFVQGSWRGISNVIDAVIISAILFIVLSAYTLGCRYFYQRYSASKIQHDNHLADIQRELQSQAHEERLKTAEQAVEEAAIEKGILSELRLIIDNDLKPSYETNLRISSAPGLAEVSDPTYEITTESRSKVRRLLDNMPGGSIGISGPRGVGKTTL
jgi:flagellar biosynthesis GTPase FlhF